MMTIPLKYREFRNFGTDPCTLEMIKCLVEADWDETVDKKAEARLRDKEREERPVKMQAALEEAIQAKMAAPKNPPPRAPSPVRERVPEPPPLDITMVPSSAGIMTGARVKRTRHPVPFTPQGGRGAAGGRSPAGGRGATGGSYRAAVTVTPDTWTNPPAPPLVICPCGRETTSVGACGCSFARQLHPTHCAKCGGYGHTKDNCTSNYIV